MLKHATKGRGNFLPIAEIILQKSIEKVVFNRHMISFMIKMLI